MATGHKSSPGQAEISPKRHFLPYKTAAMREAHLLILTSGLTLSTTALAERFNHGSSYVDAISNAYSNPHTPSAQAIRRTETVVTLGGFNDRSVVENENVVVSPRTAVETSNSGMLSIISGGFNDRS